MNSDSVEPFPAYERIKVNFRPELSAIIKESRYLDRMGFSIPEAALNVALQVYKLFEFFRKKNIITWWRACNLCFRIYIM